MKSFRNVLRTRDSDGTPKSSRLRPDGRISPSHNNVLPLGMPPVTGQSSALYECASRSKMDVSSARVDTGRVGSGGGDAGSSSRRSTGRDRLHGSLEVTYSLPFLDSPKMPSAAFRSITGQTLTTEIKRLGWSAFAKKYIVVDCRYPYEYAGGHIKCAINVHDKSQLAPHFFPVHDRIPIFHCEFSHKRGPTMAQALRDFDRRVNLDRHLDGGPSVHYQEIYLLEGGYKAFFEQFRDRGLCEPNAYVAMFSDTAQLARYKNHLKRSVHSSPKSRLRAVGRKIRGIAMRPLRFSTSPPSPVASKKMKPTTPAGLSGKTSARKSHEDTPKGTKGFMRPLTEWYPVRKQARTSAEARHKSSIHNHKPDKAEGYSKTPAGALKRYVSEPIVEHPVTSDDEDSFEASNTLPDMGRLSFD